MYHIACSVDDNYINHCLTMICSLFETNGDIDLHMHVLIETLTDANRERLESLAVRYNRTLTFHKVDTSRLEGVRFRQINPLTKAAYYRILLASIMPDVDKVLYLDVDIVVIRNIRELLDTDLENYPLAAVADPYQEGVVKGNRIQLGLGARDPYFNSGVMLINLDYWRKNDSEKYLLAFARRDRHVYFHDQDALNFLFRNNWKELSPRYNKFHRRFKYPDRYVGAGDKKIYKKCPVIIHFSGGYDPKYRVIGLRYEKYYLKYRQLSGSDAISYTDSSLYNRIQPVIYDFCEMVKRRLYIKHITNRIRERRAK